MLQYATITKQYNYGRTDWTLQSKSFTYSRKGDFRGDVISPLWNMHYDWTCNKVLYLAHLPLCYMKTPQLKCQKHGTRPFSRPEQIHFIFFVLILIKEGDTFNECHHTIHHHLTSKRNWQKFLMYIISYENRQVIKQISKIYIEGILILP